MHDATQILRNEHDVILNVLDATERTAASLEAGTIVPPQVLSDTVEFLRLYADRQHHGKEEDLLFPALEKRGMRRTGGPIGMMVMEHQFGRSLIAQMAETARAYEGGDQEAGVDWADAAQNYAALLCEHISKENNILFAMAERILSPGEQQQLAAEFASVDKNKMGEGEDARLLQLAERLTAKVSPAAL